MVYHPIEHDIIIDASNIVVVAHPVLPCLFHNGCENINGTRLNCNIAFQVDAEPRDLETAHPEIAYIVVCVDYSPVTPLDSYSEEAFERLDTQL